jgi:hypothetical protein
MILWDKVLREKNMILKKENWELLCIPPTKYIFLKTIRINIFAD